MRGPRNKVGAALRAVRDWIVCGRLDVARRTIQNGTAAESRPYLVTRAFTLIELVLVMVLIAVIAALSVPSLARSMRSRALEQEGTRLLALTEYARDEARSQGVPISVWIDPTGGRYGIEPKVGYTGSEDRNRTFTLADGLKFDLGQAPTSGGVVRAAEFAPDGNLETDSLDRLRLADQSGAAVELTRTGDRLGYEFAAAATK